MVIYIALPVGSYGSWRVQMSGRKEEGRATEEEAIELAIGLARAVENFGSEALVKIERRDGSWETLRG
jgi:hypothetical protein